MAENTGLTSSNVSAGDDAEATQYNNLVTDVKKIRQESLTAGETINGATLPVPVYQNTSDNEFYACDANVSTKLNFVGFAITNSTDGNAIIIQQTGVVGGFSGLDEGEKYYVQDAVGTIGKTIGDTKIYVGRAISATQLLIEKSEQLNRNIVFGDGGDGDVTIASSTSITRDMYYNNLTIDSGQTLTTAGFRIFVKGTLTNNGTIKNNGSAASNGVNGSGINYGAGGAGGAGTLDKFLKGSGDGGAGGRGGQGSSYNNHGNQPGVAGGAGESVANALGEDGEAGDAGGAGGDYGGSSGSPGGAGGANGVATAPTPNSKVRHLPELIAMRNMYPDTPVKMNGSGSPGGSGGGGGAESWTGDWGGGGGGAGGAGGSGGSILIACSKLVNAGSIQSRGGAGGNGGNGGIGDSGAGGGGGAGGRGGAGGLVILIYNEKSGAGTIDENGGSGGTEGSGGTGTGGGTANGSDGTAGSAGNSGVDIEIII